jgi:hypothetical protein
MRFEMFTIVKIHIFVFCVKTPLRHPEDGGSPAIKVFPALSCHFRTVK